MNIMTKWVKIRVRASRKMWYVQEKTSLHCNAAFKTRKTQHLCHVMI